MSKSNKLVFFGSGPVGRATLDGLISAGFDIEAVVTKPKAEHHRGQMPVLDFASAKELKLFTPANEQQLSDLFKQTRFDSSLGVAVDYGLLFDQPSLNYFKHGIVNSHFSLLPQWRGADPISFAILSGQVKTGVSLMRLVEALDEGPLLAQAELNIDATDTTPSLTERLIKLSNSMLKQYLPKYLRGELKLTPQAGQTATYSHKLTKADGVVDWSKPAQLLEREVRAYAGWPKSRAKLHGAEVILTKARVARTGNDGDLVLKTGDGWLAIEELIAPSGRKMFGADFLRGYKK